MKSLIVVILWFQTTIAHGGAICVPIDLRDDHVAPLRNQTFFLNSKVLDSNWCFAFALANVVGQALGQAVSPEDIALKYYLKGYNSYFAENGEKVDGLMPFFRNGDPEGALGILSSSGGYCPSARFASSDSGDVGYMHLLRTAHTNVSSFETSIEKGCSPRLHLPQDLGLVGKRLEFVSYFPEDPDRERRHAEERRVGLQMIDQSLESGKLALISIVDNPHNAGFSHAVTVVGRDSTCNYIIQDSIPVSAYAQLGYPRYFEKSEGDHIEYWSPKSLGDHLSEVRHIGVTGRTP